MAKQWIYGNLLWCGIPLRVRKRKDGWYASLPRIRHHRVKIASGPWPSQQEAENQLCDWLTAVVAAAA